MRVYKVKDYQELSRKAANIISAEVIAHPSCTLGLATGSTPIGTYKQLIEWYKKGDLDFSEVKTANLDEYRGISRSNDQSYYYFMNENLFSHVNIDLKNTFIPNGENPDAEQECAMYDKLLWRLGGVDIQLLGLGHNGHIGFNEPADHFVVGTQCVQLQESTIEANKRFFASEADVPRQAYTMGIGTIMSARRILLIVSGADKAGILRQVLLGPVKPQVPASILQLHKDVIVVADEAALSQVSQEELDRLNQ